MSSVTRDTSVMMDKHAARINIVIDTIAALTPMGIAAIMVAAQKGTNVSTWEESAVGKESDDFKKKTLLLLLLL